VLTIKILKTLCLGGLAVVVVIIDDFVVAVVAFWVVFGMHKAGNSEQVSEAIVFVVFETVGVVLDVFVDIREVDVLGVVVILKSS
jgi:hypothetical protein